MTDVHFWNDPAPHRQLIRRVLAWCLASAGVATIALMLAGQFGATLAGRVLGVAATIVGGTAVVAGIVAVVAAVIDALTKGPRSSQG
jgi:hypothetical protein